MKKTALVLLAGLAVTAAFGRAVGEPAQPYAPGPIEYMVLVQNHHAKLWLAGNARNWDLAAYQADELKELLEDLAKRIPVYKDIPIAKMIESIAMAPIHDVEAAIKARDAKSFASAFDKVTAACNSCHEGSNRGFIVIQRPAASSFPNQVFAPKKK
ncbi:MAG: hypothetical protein IT536_12420 [Hyphomicrobiales bacterium]|nr:hypothetical protein [Hyphomicrobiales bacterium]